MPRLSRATGSEPASVRKRDGAVDPFDRGRIEQAVFRAAREAGHAERELAVAVTDRVIEDLAARLPHEPPHVEEIQDAVEHALMALGHDEVARAYILYRRRRAELREAKQALGVRDELKLTLNAATVLKDRYLLRDDDHRLAESTGQMMERVAAAMAAVEDRFESGAALRWRSEFARMLRELEFLPNSPTLMNAGTDLGVLSGCFVLPVEDSLESIFETLKHTALVHQAGGGTGFAFSALRPRGDLVRSTHGVASGPVSFLKVYDAATDVLKQGGRRRGANMGVLHCSHPDIVEFVDLKRDPGTVSNFNLSVGATDGFLQAVVEDASHELVNPRTGQAVATIGARELFDRIAENAWRSGDPGLLFLDRMHEANPVPTMGSFAATNPCGEVPLLPYESCNLGSVNLARHLDEDGGLDWERLDRTVTLGVRFLDDVIDASEYPIVEIEQVTSASRKIGLGVMGQAELLAALGIPYDSEEALQLCDRIAARIAATARRASEQLAVERGAFPRFGESREAAAGAPPLRNAQRTSIAPTGTISVIAGTTSGIEPMFAVGYVRNVMGTRLVEANPRFEATARQRGFYSEALMSAIVRTGRVGDRPDVPEDVRLAFVTALEIDPSWHLRMQATWQRHVDAAVSKTVNLPAEATVDDVARLYLDAWRQRVKGITVYRYGTHRDQVLAFIGEGDEPSPVPAGLVAPVVQADTEYTGGCAGHVCEY